MTRTKLRDVSAPKVTIVVPARNEARNLEVVLPLLPEVHEVIVVDGHSSDDTAEVVARVLPTAAFLQQTRKGKGNALAVGFEAATGDIVVMFDADGSADPREIDDFVTALTAGADFAKGSRVLAAGGSEDITVIRDAGNRMLTLITNVLFRTKYTDLCYGYNAFWRDVLPHLNIPSSRLPSAQWGDGFEIETLINCRVAAADLAIHEVPSVELQRIHGESNLHAVRDGLRVLKTILTERLRDGRTHTAAPAAEVLSVAHAPTPQVAAQRQAAVDNLTTAPAADTVIDLRSFDVHVEATGHLRENA
ncbi:glycosyltransferase [Kineococcus sp. R8]|uniref:glycosyltransferase family 2 protein n=1 Tax=Kineococcus siccus TaxID=2696567 RepID=UPI001411C485|nr:glycosyltransferase family 2 protein [Kineococcus siccus]NAZ81079.1 glycosyltransferase [Kineococcus siccus]